MVVMYPIAMEEVLKLTKHIVRARVAIVVIYANGNQEEVVSVILDRIAAPITEPLVSVTNVDAQMIYMDHIVRTISWVIV